ncbi:hypothetical protein [Paraburkholderia humisilvae]|uniref:Phage tail collar domain-containing protein n=1 Tax=Paraburkholderia humisilvae TaxID=627669 RepID=A0A6J5ECT8_9BURK|nr:hypothetical protein [Paraburkholderia humisilvae]CAB3764073.1 hypothetical protein LMG29542_04772 [Paraburkholderia humisilvae]
MQRINTPDGQFHAGDPSSGALGTIVTRDFMQSVQEELAAVPEAAGMTLDAAGANQPDNRQVLKAIRRLIQSPVVLADTGAANAYSAVNVPALTAETWADGFAQQVQIGHANTGPSTYAPDGLPTLPIYGMALQPLQGGELRAGGTAILVRMTIPGVNDGDPFCVLLDCYGGARQVATATEGWHAVQFGQVSGVVGEARNLKCVNDISGTSLTYTADEIVVESALGGLRYCLSNFNATVASGTTGLGGLDTGTELAPNSYYAIYAALKDDGSKGAFAQLEPANGATSVYTGVSPPGNVVATALISVWKTNGSAQFQSGFQRGRKIRFSQLAALTSTVPRTAWTPLSIAGIVPKCAVGISGWIGYLTTGLVATMNLFVAADANGNAYRQCSDSNSTGGSSSFELELIASQVLYYQAFIAGGGTYSAIDINISGYEI